MLTPTRVIASQKSLPALRQSLLSSQQSLVTPVPALAAPGSVTATTIRPRVPISPVGTTVRLNTPLTSTVVQTFSTSCFVPDYNLVKTVSVFIPVHLITCTLKFQY